MSIGQFWSPMVGQYPMPINTVTDSTFMAGDICTKPHRRLRQWGFVIVYDKLEGVTDRLGWSGRVPNGALFQNFIQYPLDRIASL